MKKTGNYNNMKKKSSKTAESVFPRQKLVMVHIDKLKGLKNVDIPIEKNLTAIMGVNGSGKSTILHALACAYAPYDKGDPYQFRFFFTPNPDSSWKDSKLSITYYDENLKKDVFREYNKASDRWKPRSNDRPKRDVFYIGIESCLPEIEKERQTSFINYSTATKDDEISSKIIESAAYILDKDYDSLKVHLTKRKKMMGVHTRHNLTYSSLSMGAGEQRLLKILSLVYEVNTYSLILIDEIEILLHTKALRRLVEVLSERASKRNLQIIFTSHSVEMSKLTQYVDIRYLQPLEEKTMVYH
jgi:AAA15 family ATPase/GTPase